MHKRGKCVRFKDGLRGRSNAAAGVGAVVVVVVGGVAAVVGAGVLEQVLAAAAAVMMSSYCVKSKVIYKRYVRHTRFTLYEST